MRKILVLDDDETGSEALRMLLEQAGYLVDTAIDGVEGLRLYAVNAYDLVISDLIMPEKDGLQTIEELVRSNPDVKILALSAGLSQMQHSAKVILPLARTVGAQQCMQKPYSPDELLGTISELLA